MELERLVSDGARRRCTGAHYDNNPAGITNATTNAGIERKITDTRYIRANNSTAVENGENFEFFVFVNCKFTKL